MHMDHGPMCMEINAHVRTEQDFDHLIQEEVNETKIFETVCSNEQKPKAVQQRNRTTFTPEQCTALEQEFSHSQYADMYTREKLSAEIKVPEDTIKVTGVSRVNCENPDTSPTCNVVARKLQNGYFFPTETETNFTPMGNSGHLTSISVAPSFFHQSNNTMVQTMTDMTLLDHRDRFAFPLIHHHTDTARTSLPLAAETIRTDHPVTQSWNQQGISFTWSQFQPDERFLFTQQPWDVNLHRYLD
ncbi:Paired box protein [Collichthys lucidus]|uniref:Paired box protein n=1 Tax=Collichthys lucidus TaxID=240159 RepID=A0A4U5VS44_COLLU|nr:Paired box protein [Collichthys lucidus]